LEACGILAGRRRWCFSYLFIDETQSSDSETKGGDVVGE
jgi:hypothetical protein